MRLTATSAPRLITPSPAKYATLGSTSTPTTYAVSHAAHPIPTTFSTHITTRRPNFHVQCSSASRSLWDRDEEVCTSAAGWSAIDRLLYYWRKSEWTQLRMLQGKMRTSECLMQRCYCTSHLLPGKDIQFISVPSHEGDIRIHFIRLSWPRLKTPPAAGHTVRPKIAFSQARNVKGERKQQWRSQTRLQCGRELFVALAPTSQSSPSSSLLAQPHEGKEYLLA